jgi:glycosyltransferase involved in cell wall biosynthesis
MLRAFAAGGHTVLAVAPENDHAVRAELAGMGVSFASVPLRRAGLNPLMDSATIASLTATLRRFRPDVVLLAAVKPIAYGALAARAAGAPVRAAMITGAGSALTGDRGRKGMLVAAVVRRLYRTGLAHVGTVFFQNADDEALFRRLGLLGDRHRVIQIAGSGIDLGAYQPVPMPPSSRLVFLMAARLLRDKGVAEYLEAARRLRREAPEVRVRLLGPIDPNPSGIREGQLRRLLRDGAVEYGGVTKDVRPHIAAAHVGVLPSYREGTPRFLLEAMAMARPVLATNVPGCRETVEEGRNGYLVDVRDVDALAGGMLKFASLGPDRLAAMGMEGRKIVEERFDVRHVNRKIMEALGL